MKSLCGSCITEQLRPSPAFVLWIFYLASNVRRTGDDQGHTRVSGYGSARECLRQRAFTFRMVPWCP